MAETGRRWGNVLQISELQTALGLSSKSALYNRIQALKPLLIEKDWLRRGANNRVLITSEGVQLFRKLEDLHATGRTLSEAVRQLRIELDGEEEPKEPREEPELHRLRTLEDTVADLVTRVGALEVTVQPETRTLGVPSFLRRLLPARRKGENPDGDGE